MEYSEWVCRCTKDMRLRPYSPSGRVRVAESVEHARVAVGAVVERLAHARDRGRRGAGGLLDRRVVLAGGEHPGDLEPLRHVLDLADGAQVGQQRVRLIGVFEREKRADELVHFARADAIVWHR